MSSAVVVGGGIAGLVSALLLRERFDKVTLVERDPVCGGLLNSVTNAQGIAFDFGTHVLSETGVPALDRLLSASLDPAQWHSFQMIKTGNYFRGRMNRSSPHIDARSLEPDVFERGFRELMAAPRDAPSTPANLKSALERKFGATFAAAICAPALRKQLGAGLEELHAGTPFVPKRLVCAEPAESRRLKQDPFLDARIAFNSYAEGVSGVRHYYPRAGGIGLWVREFERRLRSAGVTILNGRTVAVVERAGTRATGVVLDDGARHACDALVWTIAPFLLLKAAGLAPPPAVVKNRPIGLYHLVFDRAFLDENHYVTCYDDSLRTFRATLYPNVRDTPGQAPHNCTAEVIAEGGTDFKALQPLVVEELARMGIVSPLARLLSAEVQVVPAGFPATTLEFMAAAAAQSVLAAESMRNALLLGRAKCPPFFTTEVLIEAHSQVSALS